MKSKILRLPEVLEQTGLCRSTIYSLVAQDLFPRQIQLTRRSVGWLAHDVDNWLAERVSSAKTTNPIDHL